MIKINNVYKKYNNQIIFDDLNIEFATCGIHVIFGESGSGKTTLLNMIAGFEKLDKGEILLHPDDLYVVFQNHELIDSLSIKDNILLDQKENTIFHELVDYFDIKDILNSKPNEISFGQKQRVNLIRVFINKPKIILLDEPTESLDKHNKHLVMQYLKKISFDTLIIITSHHRELSMQYGDYFYEIVDHKLINQANYNVNISKLNKCNSIKRSNRKIYNKLFLIKDILNFFILSILILLPIIFNLYIYRLTYIPNTTNTYNANYLYVKKINDDFKIEDVAYKENPNYIIITEFEAFTYNNQKRSAYIYPLIDSSAPEQGVYVNQNFIIEYPDTKIGDSITLHYVLAGSIHSYDTFIEKIIYEDDLHSMSIYYNKNIFDQFLKNNIVSEFLPIIQYDYQINNPSFFLIHQSYQYHRDIYINALNHPNFIIYSPLFEERYILEKQFNSYALIFVMFYIVISLVCSFSSIVYLSKDIKERKLNYAILCSQNFNLTYLKIRYMISILSSYLFSIALFAFIFKNSMPYEYLKNSSISVAIIFISSFVYTLFIFINFNKTSISKILKNELD